MSQPCRVRQTVLFKTLWSAQSGRCAVCQAPMLVNRFEAPHARIWSQMRATIDHIRPLSKGGSDQVGNLQLLHARCNRIKGNAC